MMVLKLGWDVTVALPVKEAVTVAEILAKSYTWRESYNNGEHIYNAWPNERTFQMELINDNLFNMAKLAGKPEDAK